MSDAIKWRGSSANTDHGTPQPLFDAINVAFGPVDVDVCAEASNAKLPVFISPEQDAFRADWSDYGRVAFMNPPYGRGVTGRWLALARRWAEAGMTVIALMPASVGTGWWAREVTPHAAEVLFLVGRVRFVREGNSGGAGYDSAIVVYRPPLEWPHWRSR